MPLRMMGAARFCHNKEGVLKINIYIYANSGDAIGQRGTKYDNTYLLSPLRACSHIGPTPTIQTPEKFPQTDI